ncbi:hypothetical protein IQ243_14580 [Nostocales cyanobacterium LEGE 11386]|nr:hypothetical protein [Nostocales cyanobacterium LEGE 11386]
MTQTNYENFEQVEIRVDIIIKFAENLQVRKLADKLWIKFSDLDIKKSTVQITKVNNSENVEKILGVINSPSQQRQITVKAMNKRKPPNGHRVVF